MTPDLRLCAVHPDQPSSGTCERCGTFGCTHCLFQPICASCLARQASELPSLEGRARPATHALITTGVFNAAIGVGELLKGTRPVAVLMWAISILFLPVFVTTIVLFCRWFHLTVRHAHARNLLLGVTPAAAVGSWFIPVLNLVRPFEYTRRMLGGTNGRLELVGPWQVLWIVSNLASNASARIDNPLLPLLAVGLKVVAAVLAVGVVREVTRTVSVEPLRL